MLKSSINFCVLVLMLSVIILRVDCQCCLDYLKQGKGCLSCPKGMHLFRDNCIFDVERCKHYADGFTCNECQLGSIYDSKKNLCNEVDFQNLPNKRRIIQYHSEAQQIGINKVAYFQQLANLIMKQTNLPDDVLIQDGTISEYLDLENLSIAFLTLKNSLHKYQIKMLYRVPLSAKSEIKIQQFTQTELEAQIIEKKEKINLESNLMHFYQTQIIGFFLKKEKSDADQLLSGSVLDKNTDGANYVVYELVYSIKNVPKDEAVYDVIAIISDSQQVELKSIFRRTLKQSTIPQGQIPKVIPQVTSPEQLTPIEFQKTEEWKILNDFFSQHLGPKYKSSKLFQIKQENSQKYKHYNLCFQKEKDQSLWNISCSISPNYVITIYSETGEKEKIINDRVSPSDLFKDFYYLVSLESILEKSANRNRYLDRMINIIEAHRQQDRNYDLLDYRVRYGIGNGQQWEVHTKISKRDKRVIEATETQINPKPQESEIRNPQIQVIKEKPVIVKNDQIHPPPEPEKAISILPPKQAPSLPINTDQSVINAAIGLNEVNQEQRNTKDFLQIAETVQNINQQDLKNTDLVGAYFSMKSFTKNYHLYFKNRNSREIFQARISRDLLRRKNYYLSFSRLGY